MSARRARHEEHEEHENHERWLITYADMITLLMVLFIVLYAIGQTDVKKFEELKDSLNKGFGGDGPISIIEGSSGLMDGGGPQAVVKPVDVYEAETALQEKRQLQSARQVESAQLAEAQAEIATALEAVGIGNAVSFRREPRGLVVTVVNDRVLFDSGSATLRGEGRTVLDGLAGSLRSLPNHLAIEGHTDDRPLGGGRGFSSNWELSTARATSVLRYLLDVHHLAADRLAAAGYSDQRPVVANDSEAHRARNRRVEVVVLSEVKADAGVTGAQPGPAEEGGEPPNHTIDHRAVESAAHETHGGEHQP